MFEAKQVHNILQLFDLCKFEALSSLFVPSKDFMFDLKVTNIYVDKGGSNIARKFLFCFGFFLLNFRWFCRLPQYSKGNCFWKIQQSVKTLFVGTINNPRSKKSFVKTRFQSTKKNNLHQNLWVKLCERKNLDIHQTFREKSWSKREC